jgi:isoamylase
MHEADIEVILDVVYNHSAEGDQRGPNFSFRGIDNRTYYLLTNNMKYYRNDTGCGNTLHAANPYVHRMVVDSLRFWAHEMRVDGFRFDLASIFTRKSDGSINLEDPPIIAEISSDPDFANVRLIAEAWDLGSYQLGRNFPGMSWMQWNGRYRDTLRRFIKGDDGLVGDLATRLYGSDDLFPDDREHAYHAYQSINYICSHDGFSLYDLVSYNHKHNQANGNGNTDGTDDNHSWNHGWEGEASVPDDVMILRKRQVKNMCALLMLSNGVPMILAGDEFLNTQQGNNNPYNQDNETTWLDWDRLNQHPDVFRFFQKMIAFRKDTPTIGRSRYWREDVAWYGAQGHADFAPWVKTLAYHLKGSTQDGPDLYVMINSHWEAVSFTLQVGEPAAWKRVIDTSLPSPDDIVEPKKRKALKSAGYTVGPRSLVVLMRNN